MSAGRCLAVLSVDTHRPANRQRVRIVVREVVGDAGQACVDVGAAQFFGGDFLAGRCLHQGRAGQENRPRAVDDDRFVRHRRHIGAAGRARPHDHRDLRNPLGRHPGLVEEDSPEVLAIGEHLGLERQERAARIDQVDAGQAILERHLLGADVLLDRDREVGAALHRRVVGDDQDLAPGYAANARDEAGRRRLVVVHLERGERRQLEERRPGIEEPIDALAHGELALLAMPLEVFGSAAHPDDLGPLAKLGDELLHALAVGREHRVRRIDVRVENYHPQQSVL